MGNKIGYARCSPDKPELAAIRQIRHGLGVPADFRYFDHAHPGTSLTRSDLGHAPAADLVDASRHTGYRVPARACWTAA